MSTQNSLHQPAALAQSLLENVMIIVLNAMVLITMLDVIGRYFFNSPVPGTIEIIELMLALLVFGTLPLTTFRQEHIVVDIFDSAFKGWARRIQKTVVCLSGACVLALIAWQLWVRGSQLGGYGDLTPYLKLPLAPVAYVMSVFSAVSSCILAFMTLQAAQGTLAEAVSEIDIAIGQTEG